MPTVAVGQRILVTLNGLYFGQTTMNTFLYRVSAATGAPSDVAFFAALHTKFTAALGLAELYKECVPASGWLCNDIWYQIVGPTRYRKVVHTWAGSGNYDFETTACNLQATITRFGDVADRKNIGGIRVPIATAGSDTGGITDPLKLVLEDLAGEMLLIQSTTTPAVSLIPQVGIPGYTNDVPPVLRPVSESVDCTSVQVQNTTRVLRRRTLRVGI